MRPAAMRGRNTRHDDGQPPAPVDERRHLPGGEQRRVLPHRGQVGADADARRCRAAAATDGSKPGASASTDVLVTMPVAVGPQDGPRHGRR